MVVVQQQQDSRTAQLPAMMNVPRPVMNAFGGLVAIEDKERTASAMLILQHVEEALQGEGQEKEMPAGVKYIVHRLVDGLASPRQKAREGFFSTLCYLLRLHPSSFSPQFVLSLLTNKKSGTMKNVAKDEIRDQLIGELLLCGAVVRSGHAVGPGVLQRVVNTLCAIRTKKSYLDVTASQFLVNLMESCEGDSMHAVVWESLQAELKGPMENLSPSQLWLRLGLLKKHRESPPMWLTSTLAPKNHVALVMILMKTMGDLPKVHPVVEELVTNLAASRASSSSSLLARFWQLFLERMQGNASQAKLQILFQLLKFMVPFLRTVSEFREVVTPSVVGLLLNSLTQNDKDLKDAARGVTTVLVELIKDSQQEDSEMQLAVVMALVTPPGSVRFDQLTGHKVLALMVPHFTLKTLKGFSMTLLEMINKPVKNLEVTNRNYAAHTMGNLLSQPRACTPEAQNWKEQQLMAFLKAVVLTPGKEGDTSKDAFFTFLGKQIGRIKEYSVTLLSLVEEMDRELKVQEAAGSCACLSGDGKEQWAQVISRLATLKGKQCEEGTEAEVAKTIFLVLYCQMALHLFVDVSVAKESITEFITCYREVKKLGMLKGDDDTDENEDEDDDEDEEEERPNWVEVVTELLLSLMTQEMHLFRNVAQGLFWLLTPMMTARALSLLTDVLDTEKARELVKKEGEEDDDDEDEEGSNEDDDDEEEEGDDDDDDNNEDEDEENEDENNEEPDEGEDPNLFTLKNKMLHVAGGIDVDVDMDTVPQEELDRLDERLGALLAEYRRKHPNRKRKKGGGDSDGPQLSMDERSLMNFQTKVCDMLIVYIKEAPNMALQVGLVNPVFKALRMADLDGRQKNLQNKLATIITTLEKKKKFNTVGEISMDSWKETVKEFVSFACQLPERFLSVTQSCYSMLMQCGRSLLWMDEQAASRPDNFLTTTYVTHLETFFTKNHHFFKVLPFCEPCTYNMGGLWRVAATLLRFVCDPKVKVHKQTQALRTLQVLYSNKVLLGERSKPEAAAVEQDLFSKAHEVLSSMQVNAMFMGQFFSLLNTILQVDWQTEPRPSLDWEKLHGEVEVFKERTSKPTRRAFRKEYNIFTTALRGFLNLKEGKKKQKRKAEVLNAGDKLQKDQVKKMKDNSKSNINNNSKPLSTGGGKGEKAKKKNIKKHKVIEDDEDIQIQYDTGKAKKENNESVAPKKIMVNVGDSSTPDQRQKNTKKKVFKRKRTS